MLNTLNINLKTDIKNDRPTALGIKLMSQDKNNNKFILRFTNGGEPVTLDDTYAVDILTKFPNSGASRLTSATVRQDYATWEFDTEYITQDEMVYNYVYVRKAGSLVVSADANAFYFDVGLSEIDKDAGRVAEVYDENYQKYLDEFKDVADFTVIQQAEADRESAETTRKSNETTRISNEDARKSAEAIRLANEVERVNAENVRAEFYEGFDGRLGGLESGRVTLKNLVANGDFHNGLVGWSGTYGTLTTQNGKATLTSTKVAITMRLVANISLTKMNIYYIKTIATTTTPYRKVNVRYISDELVMTTGRNELSFYGSPTTDAPIQLEFTDNLVQSNDVSVTVDYVLAINLTSIFGAGNEPTKAEMDELIKITGYFDEITLTQKQTLTWQLKLMRQNRDALIALGGTII